MRIMVFCILAAGATAPALAQEQVICVPAETMREVLEKQHMEKTAVATLLDGDRVEAWETTGKIVVTILIPHPTAPIRCLVREMTVRRLDQGAQQ